MTSFTDILERFDGQPISNCPGRYVLRSVTETDGPEVICPGARVSRHHIETTQDTVVVTWVADWGLISYARTDGTWRHTANTPAGFRRKHVDLGLPHSG